MLPEQTIRLECLRLALSVPHAERSTSAVTLAGEYASFVQGSDKAPAPLPAEKEKPQDKGRSPR